MTHTKKKKNEVENYLDYFFVVEVEFYSDINKSVWLDNLFEFQLLFGNLTNVNILQKIKLRIKKEFENQHYHYLFTTKPIKIHIVMNLYTFPEKREKREKKKREKREEREEKERRERREKKR